MAIQSQKTYAVKLVEVIDKPLGFFVLSLLIVESFLVGIAAVSRYPAPYDFYALLIGVGMFVYVTLMVAILTWFRVENLTFDKDAHLKQKKGGTFGSKKHPVNDPGSLQGTEHPKTPRNEDLS